MNQTKLSNKQRLLVSFTLFGMFFGAGNLIFPVHLGQLAGSNSWTAIIGFCITAVAIPILAVVAIAKTHSDGLQELANKVGKRYGYFFTCLLFLTIGPFFAIPRCATTSFSSSISPMLAEGTSEQLALFIFSFIFFALVLFFSLRPGKITVWIGKIINPVFLTFFALLVITACLHPSASLADVQPDSSYTSGVFFSSLIEGYGTMDGIAGLAFGIVVIDIIRRMGVTEDEQIAKDVLHSGILTGVLMAIIYIASIIMGAQSRGAFALSETGATALSQISGYYFGSYGSWILAITITFACLKTSIGLVTSCSETFVKMFPKALSYRTWAIIFSVFSFAISNIGLSSIINYSYPVLMFIYPLTITIIILAFTGKFFEHDRIVYISVTACTMFASFFDLMKTLPESLQIPSLISFARTILPWYDLNLGWIVPSIIGFIIGLILHFLNKKKHSA